MATNTIDLTPRWDDFAVYLPSIQKQFARAVMGKADKARPMPEGVKLKDLDFLNPKSALWHYAYALYSVGQFRVGERDADVVLNRDKSATTVLGDSGGYQIGKGTLNGFDALRALKKAEDVCAAWSSAYEVKEWIVNWLELHSDYAMTLDMPLWAMSERAKNSPFHNCNAEQLTKLTVENLDFISKHKQGRTKWLNVVQGTTEDDMKKWWQAVRGYRFGGWALAGDTGWRGGAGAVIKQVLLMRDEDAFEVGLDWLHVLGVSQTRWAVLLSAVQRGLRSYCNPNLRVSFDSASANILSGKFEEIAQYPRFTHDASSWSIRAVKCPLGKAYVADEHEFAFPFASPLGDRMKLHHVTLAHDPYKGPKLDELSRHLLTNHNIWVYVRSMLEANELATLDRKDAENFVPKSLLDCVDAYEDLLACGKNKWLNKWNKYGPVFDAVDAFNSTGERLADDDDPVPPTA